MASRSRWRSKSTARLASGPSTRRARGRSRSRARDSVSPRAPAAPRSRGGDSRRRRSSSRRPCERRGPRGGRSRCRRARPRYSPSESLLSWYSFTQNAHVASRCGVSRSFGSFLPGAPGQAKLVPTTPPIPRVEAKSSPPVDHLHVVAEVGDPVPVEGLERLALEPHLPRALRVRRHGHVEVRQREERVGGSARADLHDRLGASSRWPPPTRRGRSRARPRRCLGRGVGVGGVEAARARRSGAGRRSSGRRSPTRRSPCGRRPAPASRTGSEAGHR